MRGLLSSLKRRTIFEACRYGEDTRITHLLRQMVSYLDSLAQAVLA